MALLHPGDKFPDLTLTVPGGGTCNPKHEEGAIWLALVRRPGMSSRRQHSPR
jgi:hypothetical protein